MRRRRNAGASHHVHDLKDIENGKSVSFTFNKAGTFHYHCKYYPYM